MDEDFAVESLSGDIILLGNSSWRIRGVETGKMRVEDAHGAPPSVPFWRGEAPSRTAELSAEVAAIREEISRRSPEDAQKYLQEESGLDRRGAEQAAAYVAEGRAVLGAIPTQRRIIAERFFDEGGGMQLVLHAPFGGRLNRAWGLALRKRFCTSFDLELQAAATDEGIVISLGERHSFPLASIFGFLHQRSVRDVLTKAVLAAPMFMSRWRWNATRALALLRFSNGRRVAPQIQRMRAEDLLSAVFPAATACADNQHAGDEIVIPDHPLVRETLRDCLTEAMDVEGLAGLLDRMELGEIECLAVDTPAPSAFCHEFLNANPYAYLDDAPLEERRARAVEMRRSLPPELAGEIGALDPAAIAEVAEEAWPVVRDPDELHDALLTLVWLPEDHARDWNSFIPPLIQTGRVQVLEGGVRGLVATECLAVANAAFTADSPGHDDAIHKIVQGWMESTGPVTVKELAGKLHLPQDDVNQALLRMESDGQVLRGKFRKNVNEEEWCDRRLLARIHRLTIGRLRKEIAPVTAAEFMQFLFQWQHVAPGSRLHGEQGLMEIIRQLSGFEAASSAWERHLLSLRIGKYQGELLDRLCLSGAVAWGRLSPHRSFSEDSEPSRHRRVVPTRVAPLSLFPREDMPWLLDVHGRTDLQFSSISQDIARWLSDRGASFFPEIVKGTGHLASEVEDGLWELAAAGIVTADGFDNLRALLDPRRRAGRGAGKTKRPRHSIGRWSLLRSAPTGQPSSHTPDATTVESVGRQLLRRYGVVFRDLIARETAPVAWRDLLMQYRRMELRGEIRGGRFVDGFIGEQFALPEAVETLRSMRKGQAKSQVIQISAADPLNLVGVILPGARVPAHTSNYIMFRDGVPIRVGNRLSSHDGVEDDVVDGGAEGANLVVPPRRMHAIRQQHDD